MERFNPFLAGAYQAHLDIACSKGDKRLNKRSAFVQALALLFVQQTACRLALPLLGATCAQICCASKGLPIEALAKTPFAQKQSFCEAYKSYICRRCTAYGFTNPLHGEAVQAAAQQSCARRRVCTQQTRGHNRTKATLLSGVLSGVL